MACYMLAKRKYNLGWVRWIGSGLVYFLENNLIDSNAKHFRIHWMQHHHQKKKKKKKKA